MKSVEHASMVKKVNSTCSNLAKNGFGIDHSHKKILFSKDRKCGISTWGKLDYLKSKGYHIVKDA